MNDWPDTALFDIPFAPAVLAAALALSACGGGGSEEEQHTQTPRVDCVTQPELCK